MIINLCLGDSDDTEDDTEDKTDSDEEGIGCNLLD